MDISFEKFYSINEYKKLAEIELSEKNKENPDYNKIFEQEKPFEKAIVNYLKARAKNNMLDMPSNSYTHKSNLLIYWENLIKQKLKSHEEQHIAYVFSKILRYNILNLSSKKEVITIEENYNNLIKKITEGNFQRFELECDNQCICCGQKMLMISKNWHIKLIVAKRNEHNQLECNLLTQCIEDKIYTVNVEFKTGKLLMNDWFRIPEFTKQVQYNKDYTELSINFDIGKIQSTEYAAKFGFFTIHIGNSSPKIYQDKNNFVFGYEKGNSEQKTYEEKGFICTDMWNASIIDKSRLIEIVAQEVGEEKAMKIVDNYIKEEKITCINVEPGIYHIEYATSKSLNKYNTEIPKDIETIFTMKKETLKKKLKL